MSRVLFFSLPAHGHVNPTLPLVRELVRRGHDVRYCMAESFRAKIEATGAEFVAIDAFLPPAPDDLQKRAGVDFASLIEMATDTTLAMGDWMRQEIENRRPDIVIADSVCAWGKLFAWKYGLPWICSTTSLAFNEHSARYMKPKLNETLRMMLGMPRMNTATKRLQAAGYPVDSFIRLVENRNDVDTIVYTTRAFQPMEQTFGERFAFVGPCVGELPEPQRDRSRPLVYVSLGTVLSNGAFFRRCVQALGELDCDAVLSIGENTDVAALGKLPDHVRAYSRVDQLRVLAGADAFITHCGMNSASEALLLGVPMVLFPQHSEENAVALRVEEVGAGVRLKKSSAQGIRDAVRAVLNNPSYKEGALRMREDFLRGGGAAQAADFVECAMRRG